MNILIENKNLKLTLNKNILTIYTNDIVKIQIQLSITKNELDYEYSEYQECNKIFHIIFFNCLKNCNNNLRELIFDYFDDLEYKLVIKKME